MGNKKLYPFLLIATGASLWGIIAVFIRGLAEAGFDSMEIVTIRVCLSTLILGVVGILFFRSHLLIKVKDIGLFIGTGIFSMIFFNWCYFYAINKMDISLAVVLLYTAPAFVTMLSYLFLKERINSKKIFAVIATIGGCILIAGANFAGSSSFTVSGVLAGLGAGFGYALYTIFGKFALKKYHPFTVTFYTFLVASVVLLPTSNVLENSYPIVRGEVVKYGVGLALFSTVIAYFLYTKGLEMVEGSKASVIATVEPVVATIMGIFLYNETMNLYQVSGSALILFSAIFVNLPEKSQKIDLNQNAKAPI
ncbi:Threonine/homoserine efflux transporter RhtA [Bacillus sp. cl95]|nr:Threonine/homoserine efflux transporter RhtA [Bacillus sp. UNCCL13]SFQ81508.1 Threonine/homoserine efflux transporter RhtA [Bacillus sp. cl95]